MARKSSVQHRRLSRLFRRAPAEIVEPVREAVADAAQLVLVSAKQNAPVDEGTLRDAISGKLSRSGLSAEVGLRGKIAQRDAFYGVFVEFGTKGSPEKNIPPMPARPFLYPALDQNRARIIKDLDKAVDGALQKLSRG